VTSEADYKKKAMARQALIRSARIAHSQGFSPEFWSMHPETQGMKFTFSLKEDILTHIAAFVWTFSR